MAAKKATPRGQAAPPATTAPSAPESAAVPSAAPAQAGDLDHLPLTMTVEIGRSRRTLAGVQEFGVHTLVELDSKVGEPVDVRLNGRLWARGEVVTVGDRFGVRLVDIVSPQGG